MATQPSLPNMTTNRKWASLNEQTGNVETSIGVAQLLVTAAQMLALKATPQKVLVAPIITGEAVIVRRIHLSYNFVTTAYTLNAGTLKLFYGVVANGHALCADQSGSFLTAAASRKIVGIPALVVAVDTNANTTNQAIYIANDGAAEYTLGDATLTVTIEYSVTTP